MQVVAGECDLDIERKDRADCPAELVAEMRALENFKSAEFQRDRECAVFIEQPGIGEKAVDHRDIAPQQLEKIGQHLHGEQRGGVAAENACLPEPEPLCECRFKLGELRKGHIAVERGLKPELRALGVGQHALQPAAQHSIGHFCAVFPQKITQGLFHVIVPFDGS